MFFFFPLCWCRCQCGKPNPLAGFMFKPHRTYFEVHEFMPLIRRLLENHAVPLLFFHYTGTVDTLQTHSYPLFYWSSMIIVTVVTDESVLFLCGHYNQYCHDLGLLVWLFLRFCVSFLWPLVPLRYCRYHAVSRLTASEQLLTGPWTYIVFKVRNELGTSNVSIVNIAIFCALLCQPLPSNILSPPLLESVSL